MGGSARVLIKTAIGMESLVAVSMITNVNTTKNLGENLKRKIQSTIKKKQK